MKYSIVILLAISLWLPAQAQQKDAVRAPVKQVSTPLDSVQQAGRQLKTKGSKALDSLKQSVDSLHLVQSLKKKQAHMDSLQAGLHQKKDSLAAALNPSQAINKATVKLTTKADSLLHHWGGNKLDSVQQKLNATTHKLKTKAAKAEAGFSEKASLFSANGISIPTGGDLLPGANISLPSVSMPSAPETPSLSGITDASMPSLPAATTDMKAPDLNELAKPINENITNATDKVKETTQIKELSELKDNLGTVREAGQKIESIKKEGVGKAAEEAVAQSEPIKALSEEMAQADKMKRYYDPEVAKEEALNKAKMEAVNHFAGHENELKQVMEQLASVKSKLPEAEGIVDLFAKRQNTQRGKKWHQRLVYGVDLQLQKPDAIWLDLSPYVLYKLSDKVRVGAGWNGRLAYHTKEENWRSKEYIHGPRITGEWIAKRDIALKAEVEYMNAVYPSRLLNGQLIEYHQREWVWSYFAGVKKRFAFSKALKGNVQVLYNLYNPDHRSPYAGRLNVRMGFEWRSKSKP